MEDGLCSRAFTKLHSKLWECIFERMKHLGVDLCSGPKKKQGQPVRAKKSIQKRLILQSRKARGIIFIYNHIMILCNLPVVLLKQFKTERSKHIQTIHCRDPVHRNPWKKICSWNVLKSQSDKSKKRSKICWSNAAQSMSRHLTSQDSRALYLNELAWR